MNNPQELPKLPLWRALMYCSGNMSSQLLQWTFGMYLMYFYCPPAGSGLISLLPIATVSLILSAGRIIDGFLEPIVGFWSDRTRTRWGRRIPFIMFGGLPMCVFFLLMWYPPFKPNTWQMAAWLMGTQTLFWLSVTTVFCPYLALLAEIVRTNKERVTLSMIMQVFLVIGTGVVMALPSMFEPIREHREMFVIIAVMGLISIYAVVFGVPEKKYCGEHAAEQYGILEALKWTFTNKAFVIYLIGSLFMWLGFQILMNGLMYVNTVLLGKPEGYMMVWFGVIFLSVAISFVVILKLLDRVTKKTFYLVGNLWMAITIPMLYFLGYDSIFGIKTIYFAYVFFVLAGFPVAVLMSLGLPILADIADYDAKLVGKRREAIFFGAQGILQKFVISLSFIIQGALFNQFGYSMTNNMGVRLLGPATGVFVIIGVAVFYFYPLNERTLELEPVRLFGAKK